MILCILVRIVSFIVIITDITYVLQFVNKNTHNHFFGILENLGCHLGYIFYIMLTALLALIWYKIY